MNNKHSFDFHNKMNSQLLVSIRACVFKVLCNYDIFQLVSIRARVFKLLCNYDNFQRRITNFISLDFHTYKIVKIEKTVENIRSEKVPQSFVDSNLHL